MTTHYHYYSPLGPFKGMRTICLELKKCKINTSFFAQAENNPLGHSKVSKYLPLKNTFKQICLFCLHNDCIIYSPLPKHNSYFMGFLNGSKWFSKTNRYYFYTNTEVTEVTIKCYCLANYKLKVIFWYIHLTSSIKMPRILMITLFFPQLIIPG